MAPGAKSASQREDDGVYPHAARRTTVHQDENVNCVALVTPRTWLFNGFMSTAA